MAVDFTGTAGERKLTGVATGTLSSDSTDAVNGSQLYATNQRLGTAETNIDNLTQTVNNINNGVVGLVQQDDASREITVAKDKDGTTVNFTGTAGARVLEGVAAGAVNASSLQAVNGSQLYAVSQSMANNLGGGSVVNSDGTISAPSYSVGGKTVNNVGDAIASLDDRTSQNSSDIADLKDGMGDISGNVNEINNNITTINNNVSNLDNRVTTWRTPSAMAASATVVWSAPMSAIPRRWPRLPVKIR